MLQHVQSYRNELLKYLTSINENIEWNGFINQNAALPPERLMNKVKSLVWVDKDLSYDNGTQENLKLFTYYTSLLNKHAVILNGNPTVYILDVANESEACSPLDEFIVNSIKSKISVLTRLLTLMRVQYQLVTSIPSEAKVVIPTASITYKSPNSLFNSFTGILVPDNFHNMYQEDYEQELCFFILSVLQLSKNTDITIPEILSQRYGLMKFKQN